MYQALDIADGFIPDVWRGKKVRLELIDFLPPTSKGLVILHNLGLIHDKFKIPGSTQR